jgi:hypothetical protein
MGVNRRIPAEQEPLGIIISRGPKGETAPTFRAYVWGPVPEIATEPGEAKAA